MPSENNDSVSESYLFRPNLSPFPFKNGYKIQIQTTSRCNGKCIICPHIGSWHRHNPGMMTDEVFERIISQIRRIHISKICMYLQNEPFLDPNFMPRLERVASALEFGHVEISTNASVLTEEFSDQLARVLKDVPHELWISFHGCDERTYTGMMGLDFCRAVDNITYLLQLSQTTPLRIVIRGAGKGIAPGLRTPYDFSEYDFRVLWHRQFRKNRIKKLPGLFYHPYNSRSGHIRYNELRQSHVVRQSLENFSCSRISNWLHFLYTGELVICCMDYHREEVFGDIRNMDLEKILGSDQFLNLKRRVEGRLPSCPDFICKRCTHPGD